MALRSTLEPVIGTTSVLLNFTTTSSKDSTTIAMVDEKTSTNGYEYVNSHQVQHVVNIVMLVIVIIIFIFLLSHIFIRLHYKAKTDYALEELRRTFEANEKAPSPFAAPKITASPKSKELVLAATPTKNFEIMVNPDQLAPILHHMAMGKPQKAEEPNKQVVYVGPSK